jgi:hypothetical protein
VSAVFIGLVTHPRSRFNASGMATQQAEALAEALRKRGRSAAVLVSDRDDYRPADLPLSSLDLRRSGARQGTVEYRWRRYLAAGGGRPCRSAFADWMFRIAMSIKRAATADRAAAVRLLNIDLSHLRVMDAAVEDGSEWTLVLEDDAWVADPDLCAASLIEAMDVLASTPVAFASLSESIPYDQLGVVGIVSGVVDPEVPGWLVATSRPVTNTVCANLYRTTFLVDVAAGIRGQGLVPVVPIDWRLNEQVIRMWDAGSLTSSSCVWANPGLFLQGSMHQLDN